MLIFLQSDLVDKKFSIIIHAKDQCHQNQFQIISTNLIYKKLDIRVELIIWWWWVVITVQVRIFRDNRINSIYNKKISLLETAFKIVKLSISFKKKMAESFKIISMATCPEELSRILLLLKIINLLFQKINNLFC